MAKVDIIALNERTRQKIYPNDVEAITGQVLQDQLVDMNNTLADGINSNDTTATDHERRLGVIEQEQKEDGLKIDSLDKEMGQVKGGLTAEVERAKTAEGANKQAIGANSQEITALKKKQTDDGKRIDSLGQELTQVKTSVSNETARATAAEDALGKRIDNTYTKAETDEQIAAVAGSVYKTKGSVQNAAALLALTNVEVGDTYNVIEAGTIDGKPFIAGSNLVATKDGLGNQPNMWDPLGGTFDTTLFLEKSDAAKTYATIENLDKEVARAKGEEKKNADGLAAEITRAKDREDELAKPPKGGYNKTMIESIVPYIKFNDDTGLYYVEYAGRKVEGLTEKDMFLSIVASFPNYADIYLGESNEAEYLFSKQAVSNGQIDITGGLIFCRVFTYTKYRERLANSITFDSSPNMEFVFGYINTKKFKINAPKLKFIQIVCNKYFNNTSYDLGKSPLLGYEVFAKIPVNVYGDFYSNTTTVTVASLPYSLLTGTATSEQYQATGQTQEEWQQVVTDSTAKGITYTQALERAAATRFRRALPEPTRVEGNEIVAATGKALHRVGSDVYFDRATLLSGETVSDFVEIDREEALAIIEAKEADEAAKYQPMEGAFND